MHDTWKELERACERATKELCELNDRLDQNKTVLSPVDLDNLTKTVETIKNSKSAMKKIIELDEMTNENQNRGYSGGYSGTNFMSQPVWDKRYSGNTYRGTYTMDTGNGYSGRRGGRRGYSMDSEKEDLIARLENLMSRARTESEANEIRDSIAAIERM